MRITDPVQPDIPETAPVSGWFEQLQNLWQLDNLATEINQESQARVAFVGLPNSGKRMLFNRLRGWSISWGSHSTPAEDSPTIEGYGFFVLVDLPVGVVPAGNEIFLTLGDPALIVYVIDGNIGLRSADYRWVSLLRSFSRPLLIALNKCDLLDNVEQRQQQIQQQLGMAAIPISAFSGLNVENQLLPAMLNAAPRLAVPLGREIICLRRLVSRRVAAQAAYLTGLLSTQPIPLLDLPFQAMIQIGVVMRIAAAYGHPPAGGLSRELIGTITATLTTRYLTQTLIKLIPFAGWLTSGFMGAITTIAIGETAIRYYEGYRLPRQANRLKSKIGRYFSKKRQSA